MCQFLPWWRNGIRGGLKNHWEQSRVSSTLTHGTIIKNYDSYRYENRLSF